MIFLIIGFLTRKGDKATVLRGADDNRFRQIEVIDAIDAAIGLAFLFVSRRREMGLDWLRDGEGDGTLEEGAALEEVKLSIKLKNRSRDGYGPRDRVVRGYIGSNY